MCPGGDITLPYREASFRFYRDFRMTYKNDSKTDKERDAKKDKRLSMANTGIVLMLT